MLEPSQFIPRFVTLEQLLLIYTIFRAKRTLRRRDPVGDKQNRPFSRWLPIAVFIRPNTEHLLLRFMRTGHKKASARYPATAETGNRGEIDRTAESTSLDSAQFSLAQSSREAPG